MKTMTTAPLVAILRGIRPEEIDSHLPLLIEAGFTAIEIPLNSPDWEISIGHAVSAYGDRVTIGAGTVLSVENVDRLAALGCRLIISPNSNPAVIRRALHHDMQAMPGCATPGEAFIAIEAGARQLKLFPASFFGPDYVRALKTVLPTSVALFAVGGVTPETLPRYLAAGCAGAGIGGELYRAGQPAEQTQRQALAFIAAHQRFITPSQQNGKSI
jgi:2-dehydro-3-deoxyphosphogalactonate aldolase